MAQRATSALIVGGGLIGATAALRLQEAGLSCTLIDPETDPRPASWGNAGHIATEQVTPLASPAMVRGAYRRLFFRGGPVALPPAEIAAWGPFLARLVAASTPKRFAAGSVALAAFQAEAMPAWRRLADDLGEPGLLREGGHFVVWESVKGAAAGRAAWATADTGATTFRDATRDELEALATLMRRPPAGAIRFAGSGQIVDLPLLAERLAEAFVRAGGTRHPAKVAGLRPQGVRLAGGETLGADIVLVAAGIGSRALLSPLGHHVPMIAERGYHIQAEGARWPSDLPPVVFEERSVVVTRFRSGLRATSFVEFARGNAPADPAKWTRLRRHVADLGLAFELPGTQWMGARPTLPDYLPAIGRSTRLPSLFYAFGHQHLGLTLAAATAETVAALATGAPAALDLTPFDLERFT